MDIFVSILLIVILLVIVIGMIKFYYIHVDELAVNENIFDSQLLANNPENTVNTDEYIQKILGNHYTSALEGEYSKDLLDEILNSLVYKKMLRRVETYGIDSLYELIVNEKQENQIFLSLKLYKNYEELVIHYKDVDEVKLEYLKIAFSPAKVIIPFSPYVMNDFRLEPIILPKLNNITNIVNSSYEEVLHKLTVIRDKGYGGTLITGQHQVGKSTLALKLMYDLCNENTLVVNLEVDSISSKYLQRVKQMIMSSSKTNIVLNLGQTFDAFISDKSLSNQHSLLSEFLSNSIFGGKKISWIAVSNTSRETLLPIWKERFKSEVVLRPLNKKELEEYAGGISAIDKPIPNGEYNYSNVVEYFNFN